MSKLSFKRKSSERRRNRDKQVSVDCRLPSDAGMTSQRFDRESRELLALFARRRFDDAIEHGNRFIERWPDQAFGYKVTGVSCHELKRHAEARDRLLKALELKPEDGETLLNLGVVLFSLDELAPAKEILLRAQKLYPEDGNVYSRLGFIYFREGQYQIARHLLEKAIAFDPQRSEAHKTLGDTLMELGETDLAIFHLERSLELRPNFVLAMINLAILYDNNGSPHRAIELLEKVIELNPDNSAAISNLGTSLIRSGRFEEAMDFFRHVQSIDADHPEAFRQLAIGRQYGADDAMVRHMAERFEDERLPIADRVLIGFGLGTIFDRAARHKEAFSAYSRANTLHRSTLDYDIGREIATVTGIMETCDTGYFAGLGHIDVDVCQESPIFIIGSPRSGSTLVEQIISAHPDVAGAGEVPFMRQISDRLCNEALKPFPEPLLMFKSDTAAILGRDYMKKLRDRAGTEANRFTDKLLYNFLFIGLIQRILPRAKIIHVKRNPLDSCLSMYFLKFAIGQNYSYDLTELGQYYRLYQKLMNHWHEVLPGRIHEISYENLVADIEGTTRSLLDHCEIPFHPACLDFHKNKRQVITASNAQVREKLFTRSISRSDPYLPWLGPLIDALDCSPLPASSRTGSAPADPQSSPQAGGSNPPSRMEHHDQTRSPAG